MDSYFILWVIIQYYFIFLLKFFQLWPLRTLSVVSFATFFFNINLFIYLFIYFWLCWVFISVRGLSLVAASGGHSSSWCAGLSLSRPLLLQSTGSRRAGSVVVAHGPSCSAACGIFPGHGSNPCPLHWQADSQPLCHQGSPSFATFKYSHKCLVVVVFETLLTFWCYKMSQAFIYPTPVLESAMVPKSPLILLDKGIRNQSLGNEYTCCYQVLFA